MRCTLTPLLVASATMLASPAISATPPTQVTELFSSRVTSAGQPIRLPPEAKIRVSRYVIAPGATLPIHQHPAQRYAYVLSGEIDVILTEHAHSKHFGTGAFIVEATNAWHLGTNPGKEPAVLLVIDQMPLEATGNVILQSAKAPK